MKLGKILGTVVCETKDPSLNGVKLLLLQPLDEDYREEGSAIVACDTVSAGPGDYVLWEGGREAALTLQDWFNPSDAAVIGIIDRVDKEGR